MSHPLRSDTAAVAHPLRSDTAAVAHPQHDEGRPEWGGLLRAGVPLAHGEGRYEAQRRRRMARAKPTSSKPMTPGQLLPAGA